MKTRTAIISLKIIDRVTAGLCVPASLVAAITLLLSGPSATFAGSATWDLNPASGDWNTAANWTPATVPNSSADTATFAFSNTTTISISANTTVDGITFTAAATNPYTITANPNLTLTLSGAGITNSSGATQSFVMGVDSSGNVGTIAFTKSATAGNITAITTDGAVVIPPPGFSGFGGRVQFTDSSTAGSATITNKGSTVGDTNSGASGGEAQFFDTSTAGSATIINKGGSGSSGTVNRAGGGKTFFFDSSTAGSAAITNNAGSAAFQAGGGETFFFDTSTAGSAMIANNGSAVGTFNDAGAGDTVFTDSSTAGNATIINNGGMASGAHGGTTGFIADSSVGNTTIINNGGTVSGAFGGNTEFSNSSTVGNATIINNGGMASGAFGGNTVITNGATVASSLTIINNGGMVSGAFGGVTGFNFSTVGSVTITNNGAIAGGAQGGDTILFDGSTAGNATITNNGGTASGAQGGNTQFTGRATAGNATLIANGGSNGGSGGSIQFLNDSTGGTPRVEVFGNGNLDVSPHLFSSMVTIGSIEGDGNVFLGANNLIVGSNNMSTTFSGVIQDGGENNGTGGSLTKAGTGTLDLTGASSYTGNTNINGGVLKVDGSITSNTFVNRHGTLAGTGTIIGDVINNRGGIVSPGDAPGALTVNNYAQMSTSTLLIDLAGLNTGQFSILNVLGNADLQPNALLNPVLLNGFVPAIDDSFTFMNYTSLTGEFFIHDRNFNGGLEHWSIGFHPTYAVLTAEAGRVPVPDHASTLLLLTLGLVGLVTPRYFLLRKQA